MEGVQRLAGEIGPRRATTLAEAQAAAYLDGRLRRSGLRVSVDSFQVIESIGVEGILLTMCAITSVALYYWLPLPSLALSLWCLLIALVGLRAGYLPLLARKRFSQNVIATRAATHPPRWRVVLMTPLDSPPTAGRLVRILACGWRMWLCRLVACGVLVLFTLIGLWELQHSLQNAYRWWYAQIIPTISLIIQAILEIRVRRAPATAGAINHAGGLATLLAVAEETTSLDCTELWVVMLGATTTQAGISDLLRRYPFDPQQTLFIGVEGIGGGTLSYLTKQGMLPAKDADPLLLQLAAQVDSADPFINAEPRARTGENTLVESLARAGFRTLTIICLDSEGHTPYYGSLADTPDIVQAPILERTVRLISGLIRKIETTPLPS